MNNIHEEKLFNLNGEIVELKPVVCSSGKSVDEEAAEDLLAHQLEDEGCREEASVRKLSYGEIGFGPATSKYQQTTNETSVPLIRFLFV